jgi:hypothetical protein
LVWQANKNAAAIERIKILIGVFLISEISVYLLIVRILQTKISRQLLELSAYFLNGTKPA